MSNLVPEEWCLISISDICNGKHGVVDGPFGSNLKTEHYRETGIPVFQSGFVTSNRFIKKNYVFVDQEKYQEQIRSSAAPSDILMAKIGMNAGACAIIPKGHPVGILAGNSLKMTVNKDVASNYFLVSHLHFMQLNGELGKLLTETAQPAISISTLRRHLVPLPPLSEQRKIAAILTSVDEVIEKTQAQIDKLKDLKTAMMQTLLTNGVGTKHGDKYVPHIEFKDSPVGRIPKNWEVSSLGELASFITSGSRGWAEYYSKSGAMFIRIGNLTREHINFRFKDVVHVTPPNSAEGKRTLVKTGDVLISITADLGIIAVVNDDLGEAYVNQHISLVRLNNPEISRWVGHFLSYENSQKQFTANNDSGAKAGLNLMSIRNTKVAIPPIEEMHQIVKTLDSLDSWIAIKQEKLSKVQDNKKALMQDLLTGKVRVKVDNDSVV
ncbi:restriction endonuclease subunit S [Shewanella sp. GD04112]|uniref:restriction endonuclease subunit S n=1 Tax=Shewanella sp. GD04112 TaxID=2975434 RepID=UPI0024477AE7|nr:restriction endonuclease subunit S [Shewanella sp. GD04112]MDH0447009.1 restriction endonuclease subunit S [Shewanella sp. GD04112]